MTEPPGSADEAEAISHELAKARQRGLDDLNVDRPPQHRVETPRLDRLADVYTTATGSEPLGRVEGIKRLMRDGLASYAAAGNRQDATLIQELFFGVEGESPGSPGDRLRAARARADMSNQVRRFEARQGTAFRQFAAFLPTFASQVRPASATEPLDAAGPSPSVPPRKRLRWALGLPGVLVLGVAIVIGVWWGGSTTRVPPTAPPPVSDVALTFDALGGGSSIIRVFPGVQNTAADTLENGTFRNGDRVRAICQTVGRTVTSDTRVGEQYRQSNRWVRIVGTPELTQYATLTYADIAQDDLARLPMCPSDR